MVQQKNTSSFQISSAKSGGEIKHVIKHAEKLKTKKKT